VAAGVPERNHRVKLTNTSDVDFRLRNKSHYGFSGDTDLIDVPLHSTVTLTVKTGESCRDRNRIRGSERADGTETDGVHCAARLSEGIGIRGVIRRDERDLASSTPESNGPAFVHSPSRQLRLLSCRLDRWLFSKYIKL
jgi:hypothetical protein